MIGHNIRAATIWGLILLTGYCFGGSIGVGIAAVLLLIAQVL